LREHHRLAGTPYLADKEFQEFLEHNLMEATDRNTEHNLGRATFLHKTNRAIIVALVAVAFTAVPYSIRERTRQPRPQRVEITRIAGVAMPSNVSQSSRAAAPTVPPRPVPPSNFDVRTGVRAPKPSAPVVPRNPLEPKNFDETAGVRAPKPK
jgi:hypothetical protein